MRYRGFNITYTTDKGVERENPATHRKDIRNGYYCEIYPGDDDQYANRIDSFCLAEGYEIPEWTDHEAEKAIRDYVDREYYFLKAANDEIISERREDLVGRLGCFIGESLYGYDFYEALSEDCCMTDKEIRDAGFLSLVPYFDKDGYAQTIAEYLIDYGTEHSLSGNYLNLLARVADGLCVGEDDQYQAGVYIGNVNDLPGMINTMMNHSRFSIAKPDMTLKQIGEDHYMNVHGGYPMGSISDEEFEKMGEELLKTEGYDTPHGKAFINESPEQTFFDGKHIPAYYDKPNMVFGVFLQANGAEEFLQLPEPNSAITKAMKRLGVSDASECTIQCDYINSVTDSLTKYLDNCADRNIFDLNRLSAALILMSEDDENKFYRALDFVQHRMNIDTVGMLADIAQHNSDFVFGPGCDDEYDYGHYLIEDSGRYDYDENLADYYDYAGLGADTARMEHGLFICGDYVGIAEDSELNELLGLNGQGMGGME